MKDNDKNIKDSQIEHPPGFFENIALSLDHSFGLPKIFETEEEHKARQERIISQLKEKYHNLPVPEFSSPNKLYILSDSDFKNLKRFEETVSDNEGYDVIKSDMARLAEIGVIRHHSRGIYSLTSFGKFVIQSNNSSTAPSNLKTEHDHFREMHNGFINKV